jgi:hypothetical protein
MAETLNCRCCGGVLDVKGSLCVCKFCGATNFISLVASKNINQLNRANKLRQEREFDNAARIYDVILVENDPTADILWYRTLCEYGIEYVPDPVSDKYFPTLHRIKDESIFNCKYFNQALELAEGTQKETLLKEAKYIDEVQRKYLNIAANEDPYDVFICYKETDLDTGEKTEDVELAEELYNELTLKGTLLPLNGHDEGTNGTPYYVLQVLRYGYADNDPNSNRVGCSFDISWAVDHQRQPVSLTHVDFIRVYSAQLQQCGWLGETSTEITGAEDLHPDK